MTLFHTVWHPGSAGGAAPLPTVIALHGYGANAQDLLGLAPAIAEGRLLVLCPQAPIQIEPGYPGYAWYPFGSGQEDAATAQGAFIAREFIDWALAHYPVDPARVVLLGFSQGGMIAFRIALEQPERFRGLAALSTVLRPESAATITRGAGLERLPVLVQHGLSDPMIPIAAARETAERLRAYGMAPEYHEYRMAHAVSAESATDLSAWISRVLGLTGAA